MPLSIRRSDGTTRTVTGEGLTGRSPNLGPEPKETTMTRLKVETLTPHMSGRTMHAVGDVYEEDTEAIRQKEAAGLVRRVKDNPKPKAKSDDDAPAKSTGPTKNKAAKAATSKAKAKE